MDKILAIVTGPEHNGTTYMSKLLYSIPEVYSGFETGLLLNPDFKTCKPWCEWIFDGGERWGVPKEIDFFDKNLSLDDKYKLLFKNKGSYCKTNIHQKLIKESKYIIDKTPTYIRNLKLIRENSGNIPIIISIKYLEDYYISLCIKRRHSVSSFLKNHVEPVIENLTWIKEVKPENVFVFLYNDIIEEKFGEKLALILDLKDIEISYKNYLKKVGNTNFSIKNWKKTKVDEDITIPIDKKIVEDYNSLINQIKI